MANSHAKCSVCRGYYPQNEFFYKNSVQRICSEGCLNEYRSKSNRAPQKELKAKRAKPATPRMDPTVREHVKERDLRKCRVCSQRGTEVHHVLFRSQGGALDEGSNTILLCWSDHHDLAHGPEAKKYRQLFLAYIWLVYVEGQRLTIPQVEQRFSHLLDSNVLVTV